MKSCSINELFLLDDVQFYPLNNDEVLVFNKRNNKKIKISIDDADNARLCANFLPLEDHIHNIKLERTDVNVDEIEDSLKKVLASGLMITPREFLKSLTLTNPPEIISEKEQSKKWVLAICSADRPALVSRLLSTITSHLNDISVKPLLLMIDDSRSSKSNIKYSHIIKEYCDLHELEYEFWGREERIKYCQNLEQKLPKCKQTIQYLLSPEYHPQEDNTTGQVRTFAVLRSIGKPLLMIDDDCLINPLESTNYKPVSTPGYTGRRSHVEASYDELFIKLKKSLINPFKEHLKVLDQTFQSVTIETELSNPNYWLGKPRKILFEIAKDNNISMSVNSIAGALNSRQMDWFYHLTGEDLRQGISVLETLEDNIDLSIDQATWNGKRYNEISRGAPLVGTTICGIAPLEFIPPMPPVGRNQDLVLGASIKYIYQNSLHYQFGWGLPHLPEPTRKWYPYREQSEPQFNATSFYILLTLKLAYTCPYTSPEDRLKFFAEYLSNLAEEEIVSLLKNFLYEHHSTLIQKIEKSKQKASDSPKYQQGCKKMIGYHLKKMENISEEVSQLLKQVNTLSIPYIQALHNWPEVWSYCKNEEDI